MKKNIKDYLHLYLGCECVLDCIDVKAKTILIGCHTNGNYQVAHAHYNQDYWQAKYINPILRPLASMTDEEMIEVIQLTTPDHIEDKPTAEDYDLDIFYNDGGNMVDGDVEIGANYSCICYEGQIAIRKCGSVHFFDESGNIENAYNLPTMYKYLLSKHFDLFGLIEAGLAIDKTKELIAK